MALAMSYADRNVANVRLRITVLCFSEIAILEVPCY